MKIDNFVQLKTRLHTSLPNIYESYKCDFFYNYEIQRIIDFKNRYLVQLLKIKVEGNSKNRKHSQ